MLSGWITISEIYMQIMKKVNELSSKTLHFRRIMPKILKNIAYKGTM